MIFCSIQIYFSRIVTIAHGLFVCVRFNGSTSTKFLARKQQV